MTTPAITHPIWTYGGGSVDLGQIPTWAREVTRLMPSRIIKTEANDSNGNPDQHLKPGFPFPSPESFPAEWWDEELNWASDLALKFYELCDDPVLAEPEHASTLTSGWLMTDKTRGSYMTDADRLFGSTSIASIRDDMMKARRSALQSCFAGKWGWALASPTEVRARLGLSRTHVRVQTYPAFPSMHAACAGATAFIALSNMSTLDPVAQELPAFVLGRALLDWRLEHNWIAGVLSGLIGGWRTAAIGYGLTHHQSPWDYLLPEGTK